MVNCNFGRYTNDNYQGRILDILPILIREIITFYYYESAGWSAKLLLILNKESCHQKWLLSAVGEEFSS